MYGKKRECEEKLKSVLRESTGSVCDNNKETNKEEHDKRIIK